MPLLGPLPAVLQGVVIKSPVSFPAHNLLALPAGPLLLLSLLPVPDEMDVFQPYGLPELVNVPGITHAEDGIFPVVLIEAAGASEVLAEPLDLPLHIHPLALLDRQGPVKPIYVLCRGMIDRDRLAQDKVQVQPRPGVDNICRLREGFPVRALPVPPQGIKQHAGIGVIKINDKGMYVPGRLLTDPVIEVRAAAQQGVVPGRAKLDRVTDRHNPDALLFVLIEYDNGDLLLQISKNCFVQIPGADLFPELAQDHILFFVLFPDHLQGLIPQHYLSPLSDLSKNTQTLLSSSWRRASSGRSPLL